jgi:ribosomal-protein-alanine N-acetyltransferase
MSMAPKVTLRNQRVSDAKRFFEILSNPNFIYFPAKPKSIEDEKNFLKQNRLKRKSKTEFNYAIVYKKNLVGAVGIRIDRFRPYMGELGYFVDEKYWGKGIAPEAVKLAEKIGFGKLGLKRIEIMMIKRNKASENVAAKCGYKKEGIVQKKLLLSNRYYDGYLYAKVIS